MGQGLERAKRDALGRTGDLLNRSIQLGFHDLAHGFLYEILGFDPDNADPQGLGKSKSTNAGLTSTPKNARRPVVG